jgi:hypothetical protein
LSPLVPLLLAAAMTCPAPGSGELVGRWESHNTSKGGIGHVIDLREDGSFVESMIILVNFRYEVHGDQLLVHDTSGAGAPGAPPVQFRVEDNTFIRSIPNEPEVRAERVDASDPNEPKIVGVWKYRHYTGAIAFERYTVGGDLSLRLPMTSSTGCYLPNIEKKEISLSPGKGREKTLRFVVGAAALRLESPGKPPTDYDRSPWGAWYDFDHIDFQPPRKNP